MVTLTAILLGAKTVIAVDVNKESLEFTRRAVLRLIEAYPEVRVMVMRERERERERKCVPMSLSILLKTSLLSAV